MATQAERSANTRARFLEVGRELFSTRGFQGTSTNTLLEAAEASKGAFYHHFPSKEALFEAVFIEVSDEAINRALAQPTTVEGATESLITGALAWLDTVRQPKIARIVLEEGPRVLGFERARDLEARTSLRVMGQSLEAAILAGELHVPDVDVMARLLNALLAEAALLELRGDPEQSRGRVEASLRALIEGLRT